MNSKIIATISLVVAASLIAGTIALTTPAFAAQNRQGQDQSNNRATGGLVGANVGVQAQVQDLLNNNNVCVSAVLALTGCAQ
jgi:hypothetical protein